MSSAAIERSSTSSAKASNAVQKEATGSKDLFDTKMGTSPARFSTAEKGKQKQDLNPFGPSTSAKRLPPPTAKAVRELKGFLRNQSVQHTAKQKRIANEEATRVERLPNAANAIISNEKLDAYALAIEHPRGGDKAYDITSKTGLIANKHYDAENTQLAFDSAIRTTGYWNDRDSVKTQIRRQLESGPAYFKGSSKDGDRFDTFHTINGPKGSETVTAQWYYRIHQPGDQKSDIPFLVSLQPRKERAGEGR